MSQKHFSCYYGNWSGYDRNYQVASIPIDTIPEIIYSFFKVNDSFQIQSVDPWADTDKVIPPSTWDDPPGTLHGNLGEFRRLRQAGKKFKLSLAIGGWTLSGNFSSAVASDASRNAFVNSITSFIAQYSDLFTGVVIDWEYLSNDNVNYGLGGNVTAPSDQVNFASFLQLLRAKLPLTVSIAMCATAADDRIAFDPKVVMPYLKELHLMTYDFHSSSWGDTVSSHHTNCRPSSISKYSAQAAAQKYIALGVSPSKIMIGAAMYSRGFANTDGLGKPGSGVVPDKSWEDGVCDYKVLPLPGATEYWDDEAKAHYSYDPVKRVFNSYDTPTSVKEKCKLVYELGLKGIISWEISGDYPVSDSRSIVKTMYEQLILSQGQVAQVPLVTPVQPVSPVVAPVPVSPVVAPVQPVQPVAPVVAPVQPVIASSIPMWSSTGRYMIGDQVQYNGKVYKVLQRHQANESWSPEATVDVLWQVVAQPIVPAPVAPVAQPIVPDVPVQTPDVQPTQTSSDAPTSLVISEPGNFIRITIDGVSLSPSTKILNQTITVNGVDYAIQININVD